jgi:DNA-binding transcriptional LysR family regulator
MDNLPSRKALVSRWDNLPDLEGVRVFVAVAERRSFRGAASAVGLPRSTVSRRLSTLESALGTRLLQRTTRQVSLTPAGENFLAEVAPALGAISDAGQRLLDAHSEPRGLVRLTTTVGAAEWVGGIMLELVERYPNVRVELDFSDRQVDLVAEGFDLAVRAGKLADSTLIARPVGHGENGYYASPVYLKGRRLTHPDQLVNHQLVVYSGAARGLRWQFQIGKNLVDLPVRGRIVVSNLSVAQLAAERGHGITWLPTPFAREEIRHGVLVPVLRKFWPPPVPMQLVYPSVRHLAPQVRAAIELLAVRLKELL